MRSSIVLAGVIAGGLSLAAAGNVTAQGIERTGASVHFGRTNFQPLHFHTIHFAPPYTGGSSVTVPRGTDVRGIYPAAVYAGGPYPGAPYPGAPYPGDASPAASYPGAPYSDMYPYSGAVDTSPAPRVFTAAPAYNSGVTGTFYPYHGGFYDAPYYSVAPSSYYGPTAETVAPGPGAPE